MTVPSSPPLGSLADTIITIEEAIKVFARAFSRHPERIVVHTHIRKDAPRMIISCHTDDTSAVIGARGARIEIMRQMAHEILRHNGGGEIQITIPSKTSRRVRPRREFAVIEDRTNTDQEQPKGRVNTRLVRPGQSTADTAA